MDQPARTDDAVEPTGQPEPTRDELARLLAEVRTQQVEDWAILVRRSGVIPVAVQRSLSWRVTRPLRLAETALGVLRRDGFDRAWSIASARLFRAGRG